MKILRYRNFIDFKFSLDNFKTLLFEDNKKSQIELIIVDVDQFIF